MDTHHTINNYYFSGNLTSNTRTLAGALRVHSKGHFFQTETVRFCTCVLPSSISKLVGWLVLGREGGWGGGFVPFLDRLDRSLIDFYLVAGISQLSSCIHV